MKRGNLFALFHWAPGRDLVAHRTPKTQSRRVTSHFIDPWLRPQTANELPTPKKFILGQTKAIFLQTFRKCFRIESLNFDHRNKENIFDEK